ncbi:MAG: hypothetical protein M3N16_05035 [Actinomycetota bacterium]|nr:hypothetical protein [Actinomycetota bacterium]
MATAGLRRAGGARRQRTFLGLALVVALLLPAAIAWACNPQAYLKVYGAESTRPGDPVTVSGAYFGNGETVKLRWEPRGGTSVQSVKASRSGAFRTSIPTPNRAGAYTLVGEGATTNSRPATTSVNVGTRSAQQPDQPGEARGAPNSPPARQKFDTPSVERSRSGRSESTSGGGSQGGGSESAGGSSGGGSDAGVIQQGGRDVFAGSTPAANQRAAASGQSTTTTERPSAGAGPSELSGTGNLWGGFGGKAPALVPGADDAAAPDAGPGPQLAWGLGLLGLGLVALLSGLGVAQARRRRRTVAG